MYYDPIEAGVRIRKLRESLGHTQETFSERLHTSRNYISKLELGLRTPSLDMLIEIAEISGVTLDYLILGKESSNNRLKMEVSSLITSLEQFRNDL